jgi:hypothetical protein
MTGMLSKSIRCMAVPEDIGVTTPGVSFCLSAIPSGCIQVRGRAGSSRGLAFFLLHPASIAENFIENQQLVRCTQYYNKKFPKVCAGHIFIDRIIAGSRFELLIYGL